MKGKSMRVWTVLTIPKRENRKKVDVLLCVDGNGLLCVRETLAIRMNGTREAKKI